MSEQATLRLHFQITIMGPLVNLNAIFFLSELTCNLYWHMKMGVLFLPIIMLFWSLELQCLCSVRSWSGQVFWTWIYYHLLVFRLWQPQVRDRLSSVCVSILKRQHHQWETPGPAGCSNIYLCKRKYALWLCAIFKKLSCFSFQFSQTEELNKVCILNFMIIWWQRNQTSAFSGVRILAFGAGFFFFFCSSFFPLICKPLLLFWPRRYFSIVALPVRLPTPTIFSFSFKAFFQSAHEILKEYYLVLAFPSTLFSKATDSNKSGTVPAPGRQKQWPAPW